ncbi:radical SAM protein [Thalassomonas viridans]|uniref:Radical SAM protein n=1 Tax=Thalassomonas viridans TaxID=137584 RepID=A0AAE9Z8A4_9GAMM|nr:radical SAM protein [Thalassomonas viridans]WDE07864.1 radical SAM protein [Thalassomonas viridans]
MVKPIESKYNYKFTGSNGKKLICNGISGTIIEEPELKLTSEELSSSTRSFLYNHYFINQGQDELSLLQQRNQALEKTKKGFELTVSMHGECNFRCTYCFQDFVNEKFGDAEQERLLQYIEENLVPKEPLTIHFFGGEPLLAWKELTRLNDALMALTQKYQCPYSYYITSNGSLLTEEKVDYLSRHNVRHVKVTLDGPAHIHDQRRLKTGKNKGSFEMIMNNLAEAIKKIPIVIRINLDQKNYPHIPELLDIMKQRLIPENGRLLIDYNLVYDADAGKMEKLSYDDLDRLQQVTLEKGIALGMAPLQKSRYCKFNSPKSRLIDTKGELYVCHKSTKLGMGTLPEVVTPDKDLAIEVKNKNDVVEDVFYKVNPHCSDCNYLPMCGGGCSFLSIKDGKPSCPSWTKDVEKYLRTQYANQQLSQLQANKINIVEVAAHG